MAGMSTPELCWLGIVAFVAVTSLVRLMNAYQASLLADVRRQLEEQRRKKREAERRRKRRAKAREKKERQQRRARAA